MAAITPDTPETSAELLKAAGKLNANYEEYYSQAYKTGFNDDARKMMLGQYNAMGRYFGDEKVAKAYLDVTLKEMDRLDKDSLGHVNVLKTKARFAEIAQLHPELAAAAEKYPLSESEKNFLKEREAKKAQQAAENGKQKSSKAKSAYRFDFKNVKDRAKEFIKGSKAYAAGKDLFKAAKEGAVKGWNEPGTAFWKEAFKKNVDAFKKNPKAFTATGAAAMFAGMGTMNPALAAAGASIMAAGAIQWAVSRVRNKVKLQESKKEGAQQENAPKRQTVDGANRVILSGSAKTGR